MRLILVIGLSAAIMSCKKQNAVTVCYNRDSNVINHGISSFEKTLGTKGLQLTICKNQEHHPGTSVFVSYGDKKQDHAIDPIKTSEPSAEGYSIKNDGEQINIQAQDEKGALYGMMEVVDQLEKYGSFSNINELSIDPAISFRAIKFNLPWSPYRPGPATDVHRETCRDLKFWEEFLDMMVENRFNALTLWNAHPFPYMIRATNYPEATPFNDEELAEWKSFWKTLFKMAKDCGIETYIVNWNIVVSPEFATAYGATEYFDRSDLVKKYTRESVSQTINEYENLTGIGVTLADWMGNWGEEKMTPSEREAWIQDTFVEGIKAADRDVKFIHRAVLAGDPKEMRRVIDYADLPDKTNVEVKFNWSHGHSTPKLSLTHSNDAGTIMRDFWDPEPENYFISWTIRNEDFFVLRWGDPDFIRSHISTNHHDYVDGYFIGSEGYIPAVDYSYRNDLDKSWNYAFEKQWLFYHLWGRLLYNPDETNAALSFGFNQRYPDINGAKMLRAFTLASKVPEYLASFHKGTWDFTLYSEGFLAPWQNGFDDGESPFISLEELINHETLDQAYLSIPDYCEMKKSGIAIPDDLLTPLELAAQIQVNNHELDALVAEFRSKSTDQTLQSELDDLAIWSHLGYYFADKLEAGVAFQNYILSNNSDEKKNAIVKLEHCVSHWEKVIELTEKRYRPMPYVSMGHHEQKWPDFKEFHWKNFMPEVKRDLQFVQQ